VALRPASTVADVLSFLTRRGLLKGDFVRAEGFGVAGAAAARRELLAAAGLGDDEERARREAWGRASRLLRREEVVDESNAVLLIKTNQKAQWQGSYRLRASRTPKNVCRDGGGGTGKSKPKEKDEKKQEKEEPTDKKTRDRDRLLKRLHKSSDRQGKSKGGKGTGQDRRTGNIG